MSTISFEAELQERNTWRILRLPKQVSEELPSRGMVMVQGIMNGAPFTIDLEPDGLGSHWFHVSDQLASAANATIGESVTLHIEPMDVWAEPEVPQDLKDALVEAGLIHDWDTITTKARWEWIRWIRFTANPETRQKRIGIACSKLRGGKKRPCCFDQSRCTDLTISKGGVLSEL